MTVRYAIYFTLPQTDPLYRLAAGWLGYDAYTGKTAAFDQAHQEIANLRQHACAPSRYGFHATLKAPFRLHPAKTESQLVQAMLVFAGETSAFECAPLAIHSIHNFLALMPVKPCDRLNSLASRCVQQFEPFRAELNATEIQKRQPQQLSKQQLAYLQQWGYPYVLNEFHFHMTLTERLEKGILNKIRTALEPIFEPVLHNPLQVNQIHLFRQEEPSAGFQIISAQNLHG